jgi:uncharacterized protein (TIGR02466 family)
MKFNIEPLFSIPIQFSNIDRVFTKKELNFFKTYENKTSKNTSNYSSKNNYILNEKTLKTLKKEISNCINNYVNQIMCYENVDVYITQSWLNYTKQNEFHHVHEHPNSFLSGVLYLQTCEEDKIYFYKKKYQQISPNIKTWNSFNSSSWWFPVKNGDIILFPSELTHSVDIKKQDNTRISLAFNTFLKGTIGINNELTELILT